jgi:hypothetical protein
MKIITSSGLTLHFPSITQHTNNQLLDYHQFTIVRPTTTMSKANIPHQMVNSPTSEAHLSRLLVHQRLGHNSDEVCDIMCSLQSLLGLPKSNLIHQDHVLVLFVSQQRLYTRPVQKYLPSYSLNINDYFILIFRSGM